MNEPTLIFEYELSQVRQVSYNYIIKVTIQHNKGGKTNVKIYINLIAFKIITINLHNNKILTRKKFLHLIPIDTTYQNKLQMY